MGAVLASLRIICSEAKKIISKIYLEESSLLALARSVLLNKLEISNNILSNIIIPANKCSVYISTTYGCCFYLGFHLIIFKYIFIDEDHHLITKPLLLCCCYDVKVHFTTETIKLYSFLIYTHTHTHIGPLRVAKSVAKDGGYTIISLCQLMQTTDASRAG